MGFSEIETAIHRISARHGQPVEWFDTLTDDQQIDYLARDLQLKKGRKLLYDSAKSKEGKISEFVYGALLLMMADNL